MKKYLILYIMHSALRKGPLFYKNTPSIFHFFTKNTPISFPAYGPASVCTSVCPVVSTAAAACGRLAAERPAGRTCRSTVAVAGEHMRHHTAFSSECGQCHVDSRLDEAEDRLVTVCAISRKQ